MSFNQQFGTIRVIIILKTQSLHYNINELIGGIKIQAK